MNILEYYKYELSQIYNPEIREVVEIFLSKAPAYYMEVDAASNSRYNKDRDGNIIKLREHTKAVCRYALLLLDHPLFGNKLSRDQKDYLIGASLIHDLAKRGTSDTPSEFNLFEHPILIVKLVNLDIDLKSQIHRNHAMNLIETSIAHNGPWTRSEYSSITLPEISNQLQYYLHLCDWLASRGNTWIDISEK